MHEALEFLGVMGMAATLWLLAVRLASREDDGDGNV